MACSYVFLDSAMEELAEAAAYLSAVTGSNKAAGNLLDDVQRALEATCEFPTMHAVSRIPQLAEKGYRVVLIGSYALLYLFENETVFVAHVFHQRQDYAHLV